MFESPRIQIFCKSIPRSGHHFLATLLYMYFDKDLKYCFDHENCCMECPCPRPSDRSLLLHKSHDQRRNDRTEVKGGKFLVQTREIAAQVSSNVERLRNRKGKVFPIDDRDYAEVWLVHQYSYRRDFARRWLGTDSPASLVLDYADLLAEPEDALCKAIALFEREVDRQHVEAVVASQRTRLARHPYIDHENSVFRPRTSTNREILPPGLFEEYLELYQRPGANSRLADIYRLLESGLDQVPTEATMREAEALGNTHLLRHLRKRQVRSAPRPISSGDRQADVAP